MRLRLLWEDVQIQGGIKPTQPTMRWPDVSKVHDEESWAFYQAEYTAGDRTFVFKLTRSPQNSRVLEVDGLTSTGNGEGLQFILPKLVADAKKLELQSA